MILTAAIEAMLFASGKPVALSILKKALNVSSETLEEAVVDMEKRFNREESGIHVLVHDGKLQFVSNPKEAEQVAALQKQEASEELTRPQLETLTIIAYRGPITKPEIEQIRGINCGLILRNLLMRGLVEEREDKDRLQSVYTISMDFLRHLGLHRVDELPEYMALHADARVSELMQEKSAV